MAAQFLTLAKKLLTEDFSFSFFFFLGGGGAPFRLIVEQSSSNGVLLYSNI